MAESRYSSAPWPRWPVSCPRCAPRGSIRCRRSGLNNENQKNMILDFKFAFRKLHKAPGFAVAAVAVLAMGLGGNTAIYSLENPMLFKTPAYKKPPEVVQLFSQDKRNPKSVRSFSYPTYAD